MQRRIARPQSDFILKAVTPYNNPSLLLETTKLGLQLLLARSLIIQLFIYSEPMKMKDLITVTFYNQSASWEGRLIVCLFADTRFLERYSIF